jgi:hypothetical protein
MEIPEDFINTPEAKRFLAAESSWHAVLMEDGRAAKSGTNIDMDRYRNARNELREAREDLQRILPPTTPYPISEELRVRIGEIFKADLVSEAESIITFPRSDVAGVERASDAAFEHLLRMMVEASGGSVERLKQLVEMAKADYRDVLILDNSQWDDIE